MSKGMFNGRVIKNRDLLVICPTRERPERLKIFMQSFKKNILAEATAIVYCIDDDDPKLAEYQKIFGSKECYHIGTGRRTITVKMNHIVNTACPGYKYYGYLSDDNVIKTKHFDTKMITAIKEGGGWGLAYGNDLFQREKLPTHVFASGKLVAALGWLYLPSVRHMYGDNAWKVIGDGIRRLYYLDDVIIEHMHPMAKKAEWDDSYKYTNSQQTYKEDKASFDHWMKTQAKNDIEKVIRGIHQEAGFKKTVSLCMIVSDQEDPKRLTQCLKSVVGWVDKVNIVFNYKNFKNTYWVKKLLRVVPVPTFNTDVSWEYLRWTDFSDMRNRSLDMAWDRSAYFKSAEGKPQEYDPETDYCMYLDCDDVVDRPWHIKDTIFRHPDADCFQCRVVSFKENMAQEIILQPRIFKNKLEYRFKNYFHEDIMMAIKKDPNYKSVISGIEVIHVGNIDHKTAMKKNLRNLKLIERQMMVDPHSLIYFAHINSLILTRKKENIKKAVEVADECLEKSGLTEEDPLTPKIWILRAGACMIYHHLTKDTASFLGSKQGFQKAWDTWKHPEAGVNLAELLMIEQRWDESIAIMDEILKTEEFKIPSVPFDWDEVAKKCFLQLGDCYFIKKEWRKSGENYKEFMKYSPNHLQAGDRLCDVLRKMNRNDEAALLTMHMINTHPTYAVGWKNMASYEIMMKRYRTARVFLAEAFRIDPKDHEVRHNIRQIDLMLRKSHGNRKI